MPEHVYIRHESQVEVPFYDIDPMNIVWHGNYIKYMERARCAMLEELGYNYPTMQEHGHGWPIVKLDCKYIRPATFGQIIQIECAIVEFESCLKIRYILRDLVSRTKLTLAHTTQVAVRLDNGEMQFQTPDSFQQAIRGSNLFMPLKLQ